ncbi:MULTISPECIES: ABC transporter substrate-binding protein [unclassified Oceanispirochaeta]|uniref:substrate-binding periplasmic protein n=1 Tax=unclassified Oceanispirochaeta TaxID=2635722 RepID=UPI000E09878E|nr:MULTISPECIES: transporter substrate-binding domain-containing protein [unclassified Oceanispirochaeta]MBF9018449.1 transporter substrate-binding domain-containing protein [Oceanispirochaeta sp. M2]NPD73901.1 transporter substrate-binding domain-containing protein [Oceanispirochaeta sp. M1]RDG30360.1 hypothetical protein DV872_17535 [Oceanispirochaeta sp. M1]
MPSSTRIIIILILLSLLTSGCNKKTAEITIIPESENKTVESADDMAGQENQNRPLLEIEPGDTAFILVREDGAPGMYLGSDGELHGFYVDLEKMIMNRMGQTYEFVHYNDISLVIQGIKSGLYHIAMAVPDLPDYRSFLNLSIPYEILHYVTFVSKENMDIKGGSREEVLKSLHGKKVGVQTRGHIYQYLRDIKEIELIEYPTTTQALADLTSGAVDAVPDVMRIGIYYADQNDWSIEPRGEVIMNQKLTTAFSKRLDKGLMNRYNSALQSLILDGSLESLYKSYFGTMDEDNKPW